MKGRIIFFKILHEFSIFEIKTLIIQFGTNFGRYEGANPSSYVTDSWTHFLIFVDQKSYRFSKS